MLQAVILAGGLGTRLRPVTYKIPKLMIEINKKPFLWYLLELLKKYDFKEILLCTGYKHELIESYFGDGSQLGLKIKYSVEEKPLGTGGAVKQASKHLNNKFLLLFGDTYLPFNYKKFVKHFNKINKIGLMTVYNNLEKIAENNILLRNGLVQAYVKKEKHEKLNQKINSRFVRSLNGVDAGVYIYRKKMIRLFPDKDKFSFELDVYPKLIDIKSLAGYLTSIRYYDIGTFERLKTFERAIK